MVRNRLYVRARIAGLLLGLIAVIYSGVPEARADEPTRTGEFTVDFRDREIKVRTYKPAGYQGSAALILFHGASRDAAGYAESGRTLADKLNMLLVVPEFDRKRFDVQAYQEGGVFEGKRLLPEADWTFQSVEAIVAKVREKEKAPNLPYYVTGHSAGAQFLSRMAALAPGHASRIILVNPGSLLFPTDTLPYPFGFGNLPAELSNEQAIRRYLAAPVTFYIGTADTGSERLTSGEFAEKQGANRYERTLRCYETGKKLAAEHGWDFGWTLVKVEGAAHPSGPMWKAPQVTSAILGK